MQTLIVTVQSDALARTSAVDLLNVVSRAGVTARLTEQQPSDLDDGDIVYISFDVDDDDAERAADVLIAQADVDSIDGIPVDDGEEQFIRATQGDDAWDAYVRYMEQSAEEEQLVEDGRLIRLRPCYLCYLDQTGQVDPSPRLDSGPLRGIVGTSTVYGFDPVASARVGFDGDPYGAERLTPCGHVLI